MAAPEDDSAECPLEEEAVACIEHHSLATGGIFQNRVSKQFDIANVTMSLVSVDHRVHLAFPGCIIEEAVNHLKSRVDKRNKLSVSSKQICEYKCTIIELFS